MRRGGSSMVESGGRPSSLPLSPLGRFNLKLAARLQPTSVLGSNEDSRAPVGGLMRARTRSRRTIQAARQESMQGIAGRLHCGMASAARMAGWLGDGK